MLSSMLYQNMAMNWSIKAQKSSLDWWCHLLVGRYCWMKSSTLNSLLIFAPKRCIPCYLLMCGGHRCENLVRKFVYNARFVNMLKIAYKHPRFTGTFTHCWMKVWILVYVFYHWVNSLCKWLKCHFYLCWSFDKVHCFDCMFFRGRGVGH